MTNIGTPEFNPDEEELCPDCGGIGEVFWVDICGYVSHDMAMDACDMSYEGQPIYGELHDVCPTCEGEGYVKCEQTGITN